MVNDFDVDFDGSFNGQFEELIVNRVRELSIIFKILEEFFFSLLIERFFRLKFCINLFLFGILVNEEFFFSMIFFFGLLEEGDECFLVYFQFESLIFNL